MREKRKQWCFSALHVDLGPQASVTLDGHGTYSNVMAALQGMARLAIRFLSPESELLNTLIGNHTQGPDPGTDVVVRLTGVPATQPAYFRNAPSGRYVSMTLSRRSLLIAGLAF
ncbi:MAG: hypothetical protein AAFY05_17275 [Pseudomonadota bacterium]